MRVPRQVKPYLSCLLMRSTLSTLSIPIIAAVKFGQQKNNTSKKGKEKDTLLTNPQQCPKQQSPSKCCTCVLMRLEVLSRPHHR